MKVIFTELPNPDSGGSLRETDERLQGSHNLVVLPSVPRGSVMDLITDYKQLTRNLAATAKQIGSQAQVKRLSSDYLKRIVNVKSIDDFMNDERVYQYALTAFGLKDMLYAKAFIRKVLVEGIDSPQAFSVKLSDSRFREFAEAFNFARYGSATTSFDRTQQGTVDRYIRNALEEQAGTRDERLRLALYFQRKAPSLTGPYGVLADKAMYTVVRTALGLPAAVSGADIDKQASFISSKLTIEDFSKPEKLEKFIIRYIANATVTGGPSPGGATRPVVGLMQGVASSVDVSTLMSIQTLRRVN
jgi:hypothetical protein